MTKKKIYEFEGKKYHPFSGENVWVYDENRAKWLLIAMPDFLEYLPKQDKLAKKNQKPIIEILDCLCDSLDLFRYGCRC
tara:strand:- start:634 stop:870 length:237 start_codon:yes stop_codon:yes gene_type:complete